MKKSLFILVEIALLYMLFSAPFMQYLLSDVHQSLSNWMSDIAAIPERKTLQQLREKMLPERRNFSQQQAAYFDKITYSAEQVEHFYTLYCVNKDKNPFIYGPTLTQFCDEIRLVRADLK